MTEMTHRIFVYGTLKQGYGNNALLHDATFMGTAETPKVFKMLEPSFPVVLRAGPGNAMSVAGELYHVDDAGLARLDRLEGVRPDGSGMYTREVIDVVENGQIVQAYIYVGGLQWARSHCPAYTKVNAAGALDWVRKW